MSSSSTAAASTSTTITNLELVSELWTALKPYIHERASRIEAAAQLIELLHELEFSHTAIETIAAGDAQLRTAWRDYTLEHDDNDDVVSMMMKKDSDYFDAYDTDDDDDDDLRAVADDADYDDYDDDDDDDDRW